MRGIFLDDNERRYHTLKIYEDQYRELQKEIWQLETCYRQKSDKVNHLRKEIKQAEVRLRHYCEQEEYYKKLEKDNQLLKDEKVQFQSDRQRLMNEKNIAQEETKSLRNRSFLQRLFNK